ncbi:hypothetical protein BC629DRAFT_1552127 [Irpex lacteus]|nr:hypothetical protein BC629DRAFT_1552127 [Irpex lacteus]
MQKAGKFEGSHVAACQPWFLEVLEQRWSFCVSLILISNLTALLAWPYDGCCDRTLKDRSTSTDRRSSATLFVRE